MPEFLVELTFEYKSTYRVSGDSLTEQEAIDAAEAHDNLKHYGKALPEDAIALTVTCDGDREYSDYLEPRVFDADGSEILLDFS
jgi:hypothetical protein